MIDLVACQMSNCDSELCICIHSSMIHIAWASLVMTEPQYMSYLKPHYAVLHDCEVPNLALPMNTISTKQGLRSFHVANSVEERTSQWFLWTHCASIIEISK